MAKAAAIANEIGREIASGAYGRIGDKFLTVRELAALKTVSLRTAFGIMRGLEAEGFLAKQGKCYFLNSYVSKKSATNKPALIGCVVTTLSTPYFARLEKCLEEAVHKFGASLIVASSEYDFEREKERIGAFAAHGASGLFLCPWASSESEEAFYRTLKMPFVVIGRKLKTVPADTVTVNNQLAAQLVAEHLIERGAENFAYIGQTGKPGDERLFGFRAGLLAHNILLESADVVRTDYNDFTRCEQDIAKLLGRMKKGRLGIFCYHDLFAARVLNVCAKLGIRVPKDVLVSGFDNLPVAEETIPSLTTVRSPIEAMAATAAETLYSRMRLPYTGTGVCRYLDSELVVRGSTEN